MVKFLSYRDLRNTPSAVWDALDASEAVAILANGEPRALLLEIEDGDVERTMQLVRRVRAQMALSRLRGEAATQGAAAPADRDVDAENVAGRAAPRSRYHAPPPGAA